jgi:hypothetical protein
MELPDKSVAPITPWAKPAGMGGNNPFEEWRKRTEVYKGRYVYKERTPQ